MSTPSFGSGAPRRPERRGERGQVGAGGLLLVLIIGAAVWAILQRRAAEGVTVPAADGGVVKLNASNAADFARAQACRMECDAEVRACRVLGEVEGADADCAAVAEACTARCQAPARP